MRGQPLPGSGDATAFSDVAAYKQTEQAPIEANGTLEQRVTEQTREAEDAQRTKTHFLAAVSDDLLQLINAAQLFTSALRDGEGDAEQRRLGERVDASLRAVEDLLDGLLDVSRPDANELKPERSRFGIFMPGASARDAASSVPLAMRATPDEGLSGLRALCMDNDPGILDGMSALLARWQVRARRTHSLFFAPTCRTCCWSIATCTIGWTVWPLWMRCADSQRDACPQPCSPATAAMR